MLDSNSLETIFLSARTYNSWQEKPVTEAQLRAIYDLMKWGPTSANSQPARIVFVRSKEGKDKLCAALASGNVEKTMSAPVTAILAHDSQFFENLPRTFPHDQTARSWFSGPGMEGVAEMTAFRNGTLQGAYLIIAIRALGLDCGAMSGFNNSMVDQTFFPDRRYRSNFLCNIGYGDPTSLFQRGPRLSFDEVCTLV